MSEKKLTYCVGCNFAISKIPFQTIHGPMHRFCARTWFMVNAKYNLKNIIPKCNNCHSKGEEFDSAYDGRLLVKCTNPNRLHEKKGALRPHESCRHWSVPKE